MPQQAFLGQLQRELDEIGADFQISSEPKRFAVWVGKMIFGHDPQDLLEERILYEGSGVDSRLYVIRVGEDTEPGTELVLCRFAYTPEEQVNCGEMMKLWALTLEEASRSENPAGLTAVGQEFAEALSDDPSTPVTYYVATTGSASACAGAKLLDCDQLEVRYSRNRDPNSVVPPESLELPAASMKRGMHLKAGGASGSAVVRVHIVPLPLSLIHEWVSTHDNGLFAENLRYRLADKTDKGARQLDEAIQATVLDAPEKMLIQNNGLTITCRALEKRSDGSGVLLDPQIVNGCQTSWAIHEAVEAALLKGDATPEGLALAKIVETQDPSVAYAIATSSNRQNAILPKDQAARDVRHGHIAEALSNYATNLRVHWDFRRGAMANVQAKPEAHEYLVQKSKSKLYRILRNDLGGQVMLAMAGAVLEAKNRLADLFNPDSTLPRWAYAFDLPTSERFDGLKVEPYMESGGPDALKQYIADLMFGFAVYQHAVASFRDGYAATINALTKKAKQEQVEPASLTAEKAKHDFVRYWAFDVVRLTHRIAEAWVGRGRARVEVRRALVGDLRRARFMDPLFVGKAARPDWFHLDQDPKRPHILDPNQEGAPILLPQWFVELEELGAGVVADAKLRDPSASTRTIILSRRSTPADLDDAVAAVISGPVFERHFPLRQES